MGLFFNNVQPYLPEELMPQPLPQQPYGSNPEMLRYAREEMEYRIRSNLHLEKARVHRQLEIERLLREDEGIKELYDKMIEAQGQYEMWLELKLKV